MSDLEADDWSWCTRCREWQDCCHCTENASEDWVEDPDAWYAAELKRQDKNAPA